MTEKQILQQALIDYQHALDSGWQEIINELYKKPQELVDFRQETIPYAMGLCRYLETVQGYDYYELHHVIPVYFEVSGLTANSITRKGDLALRIEWMKRAIELIDHREQVELHRNLGNPKFAYTDDTFNRKQVKKAIWKDNL